MPDLRKALIALSLLLGTTLATQQPEAGVPSSTSQDEPIRLRSDLVPVTAAVADRNGRAVRSLRAEDFTIFEDGVRQKIAHFSPTEEPFALMLLIDLSGSTMDEIDLMKRAAANFIAELRGEDKAGVIVFSGEVEIVAGFKDSREKVMKEVESIEAPASKSPAHRFSSSTGTAYYDALYLAAAESPLKTAEGRKAIICITDAVDSASKMAFEEVGKLVEKSEASVYILHLDTEEATLAALLKDRNDPGYVNFSQSQIERYYDAFDKDSIDRHRDRRLITPLMRREINAGLYELARREAKQICERTGGRVYPVAKLGDLAGVYKQVAGDLRSQYLIGYYPLNDSRNGKWRKIRVETRQRDATIRARQGYWAPGK